MIVHKMTKNGEEKIWKKINMAVLLFSLDIKENCLHSAAILSHWLFYSYLYANILTFFNNYKSEHIMFAITGHSIILMNIATCYVFTYV